LAPTLPTGNEEVEKSPGKELSSYFHPASSKGLQKARTWRAPATGTAKEASRQPEPRSETLVLLVEMSPRRQVDSSLVDKVSNNTKHADASVLDLDSSKAIEAISLGHQQRQGQEDQKIRAEAAWTPSSF
jgi:hypothetical protein